MEQILQMQRAIQSHQAKVSSGLSFNQTIVSVGFVIVAVAMLVALVGAVRMLKAQLADQKERRQDLRERGEYRRWCQARAEMRAEQRRDAHAKDEEDEFEPQGDYYLPPELQAAVLGTAV